MPRIDHQVPDVAPVFGRDYVAGEHVGIETGPGSHRQDFIVLGIHGYGYTGIMVFVELIFGYPLKFYVQCSNNVLAFNRLDNFKIPDRTAAAIHYYAPPAFAPATGSQVAAKVWLNRGVQP